MNTVSVTIDYHALREAEIPAAASLLVRTNAGQTDDSMRVDLAKWRARFPTVQIAASLDGELIGFVGGRIDEEDSKRGWSDDTIIAQKAQRRGVGSGLITRQLDAFRALGCTHVRGLSPERHFDAIAFFERHGFRVIERTVAHGFWGIAEGEALCITERVL